MQQQEKKEGSKKKQKKPQDGLRAEGYYPFKSKTNMRECVPCNFTVDMCTYSGDLGPW